MLTIVKLHMFSGRVGSTLVMQLLGTSEEIAFDRVYPFENRYASHAVAMTQSRPLPFEPAIAPANEISLRALRAVWGDFSSMMTRTMPKARFYAEKVHPSIDMEPVRSAGVPWRMVELVRDPRDVLVSIRAFNRKRNSLAFGRAAVESEEAYTDLFIARTKDRMAAFECPAMPTSDRILIRYEDAVANLDKVADQLGAWLGVELNAQAVEEQRLRFADHMTSSGDRDSIGRWRRELSMAEQDLLTNALAPELARMGYDA